MFMKLSRLTYLIEAIAFIAITIVSIGIFGMADAATVMAGFTMAYLVPRTVYARLSHRTAAGILALAIAWTVMSVLGINYLAICTVKAGRPLSNPLLWNDAQRYFDYAVAIYHNQYDFTYVQPFPGLPLMTALLWKIFGVNIVYPLAMNMMLTLGTIVLTGVVTVSLLEHRTSKSARWLASVAMMCNALLFFFLSHGTQLLKEPLTYFGFVVVAMSLISLRNCPGWRLHWRTLAVFALGITLVAATRTTYSIMALAGVALAAISLRRKWRTSLAMIGVGTFIYIAVSEFAHSISFMHYGSYFDPQQSSLMSYQFIIGPQQEALSRIVGDYFTHSWWEKIMILPFSCAVQYVIPFPWLGPSPMGIGEIIPRICAPWYAIGALTIFYMMALSWRRHTNLKLYPLWVAFCYAVPAFVTAGSVSRYALPFQPLMIPMATYTIALLADGHYRKIFCKFAIAYIAVLLLTLAACHYLQSIALL